MSLHNSVNKINMFVISLLLLSLLVIGKAQAANEINPFIGHFEGRAVSSEEEADYRTIRVDLYKTGESSFHVAWEVEIKKSDGREKSYKQEVEFRSSEREGIYSSAMRKNLFGKWEPLNPMKGDPYIWAKLEGDTLIVYAMVITEDGGYEMQQYNRRMINENEMELKFYRIRDGERLKLIEGLLKRKEY